MYSFKIFVKKCRNFGVSFVQLIAPTTPNERISKINEYADEMIYYISMLGVTGSALKNSPNDIQKKYIEIKNGKHLCNIECAEDFSKTIELFVDQNYDEA